MFLTVKKAGKWALLFLNWSLENMKPDYLWTETPDYVSKPVGDIGLYEWASSQDLAAL